MTITSTIMQTVSKEVELPYYYKFNKAYFKVTAEESYVSVNDYDHSRGIVIMEIKPPLMGEAEAVPITEEEFNQAYQNVLNKLL